MNAQSKDESGVDDTLDQQTNTVVDALLSQGFRQQGPRLNLTRRIADRAAEMARRMNLDEEQREVIRKAALLRDVGKAGIPDSILRKSGPLTAGEFEQVRARMLPEDDIEDSERVQAAIIIAHHHHERFDGEGYPDGLHGEYIPLGSRILGAAEAYETMLIDAPWRPARKPDEALGE
ncbi:MAG: HD domain-containing protein, partial [Chloroflexi bacterium]|nr:HD domain-containing protein [Chloroflexota bacterium]